MPPATRAAARASTRASPARSPIAAMISTSTCTTRPTPMARSAASCAAGLGPGSGGFGCLRRAAALFRLRLLRGLSARIRVGAGIAKPFLEAFEEAAKAVDRGASEGLGEPGPLTAAGSRGPARGGADRCRGEVAHERVRAHLDCLAVLLADLLGQLHTRDLLRDLHAFCHGRASSCINLITHCGGCKAHSTRISALIPSARWMRLELRAR